MSRSLRNPPDQPAPDRVLPARVLIVDDDPDVRDSLREVLSDAGYEADGVGNGDEALAYLRRSPRPAAILLDLFMPVMSGWDFTRRLRGTRFEAIPIVLVTSSEPHWGYPVAHVLRKPIDVDALLTTVRTVTGSPSSRPSTYVSP